MGSDLGEKNTKRKAIPKKVRFEVFKRDNFRCQYCGRAAPDVLLQVDHVEPHSKGGSNAIENLITACFDCNSGKGATRLSDQTVLDKTRAQIEQLQERRSQLEMMLAWKSGLLDLKKETVDRISDFWTRKTPGRAVSGDDKRAISKWLATFTVEEIIDAMNVASERYLKLNESGNVTVESGSLAFAKIPGICKLSKMPDVDQSPYYIRGILRKRFPNDRAFQTSYEAIKTLELITDGLGSGIPREEIQKRAESLKSMGEFRAWIEREYDTRMAASTDATRSLQLKSQCNSTLASS